MYVFRLSKVYHNKDHTSKCALNNVDLEFTTCGMVVILGPSGCGKTTLLNILAGRDKDYEGEVKGLMKSDIIDQDFRLFESLTVLENLKIVSKDDTKIMSFLTSFKMEDLKDKKVKKLSNGQKRRVQVMRSLLLDRDLLLCDEPTAALDNELATIIMEALKEYSKDHLVIMSTHDIALAEKYADRLIKIDEGKILSDEVIDKAQAIVHHKTKPRPKIGDHLSFIFRYIRSRSAFFLFSSFFFVVILALTYLAYSLFMTISANSNEAISFRKHTNLIVSEPYKERQDADNLDVFVIYDRYTKEQMEMLTSYVPEIIAVQMYSEQDLYYPRNYYSYGTTGAEMRGISEEEYEQLLQREFQYQDETYHTFSKEDEYVFEGELISSVFSLPDLIMFKPRLVSKNQAGLYTETQAYIEYYDLVNGYEPPLKCGELPSGDDEVIISLNLAEYLVSFFELEDMNDLIGREIYTSVDTTGSVTIGSDKYKNPYVIKLMIKGISNLEFKEDEHVIFFDHGILNNANMKTVLKSTDTYEADIVKIYIDPSADIEMVLDDINKTITPQDSRFIEYTYSIASDGITYDSPSSLLIYVVILDLIFIIAYFIIKFTDRKRYKKEADLLKNYRYDPLFISVFKTLSMMIISIIIFILIIYLLTPYINELALSFNYATIMEFEVIGITFVSVLITIIFILINGTLET